MKINIFILSMLSIIEGIVMIPCAILGYYYREFYSANSLLFAGMILSALGLTGLVLHGKKSYNIRQREGYLVASVVWLGSSIIAAIPFVISGYSIIDSIFETTAAFTTTGATAINFELMPKCLILWRSVCNWMGGMGILVLLVWIFPALGISGQLMASVESSGPVVHRFEAKYSLNGKYLYLVYIIFTAVEFLLLLIPLDPFNAIINTFSSISTAGLIITSDNSALMVLPMVQVVITLFTILSSINFAYYLKIAKKENNRSVEALEVKVFLLIIIGATLIIGADLYLTGTKSSITDSFIKAFEQVVSFASTSGYYVESVSTWPTLCTTILMTLLIIGGCTMSTSGSLKVIRVILMYKLTHRSLYQQIHPRAIKAVVLRKKVISAEIVSKTTTHIIMYFLAFFMGAFLLSFNGFNLEFTIMSALSAFSNAGITIPTPTGTNAYEMFNGFSKLVLSFLMIAGRLEMYSIMLLFSRRFWQQDKIKPL